MDVVVGSLELAKLDDERLVSDAQEALRSPMLDLVVRVLRLASLCAGPIIAWRMRGEALHVGAGFGIGVVVATLLGAGWRRVLGRRVQTHLQLLRARYGQALALERLRVPGRTSVVLQGRHLPHGEHFFVHAVLGSDATVEAVRGPLIELQDKALPLEGIERSKRQLSEQAQEALSALIDALRREPAEEGAASRFDGSPCQVLIVEGERVERVFHNLSEREEGSDEPTARLARLLYQQVELI